MRATRAGLASTVAAAALLGVPAGAAAATINVTATADAANPPGCSLREAVQAARDDTPHQGCPAGSAASLDTIVLLARTYELAFGPVDEEANAGGDLDLGSGTLVIGVSRRATKVTTSLGDRVFHFTGTSGTAALQALTVSGGDALGLGAGDALGGNVRFDGGEMALRDVRVAGGAAVGGGGVYAAGDGRLTIRGSRIEGNHATSAGGGLDAVEDVSVRVSRSAFEDNRADSSADPGPAAGGAISYGATDMTAEIAIADSAVTGNRAITPDASLAAGGGISLGGNGSIAIRRSLIAGNAAASDGAAELGGGVHLESAATAPALIVNSTIYGNTVADGAGRGGGLFVGAGSVEVRHSTFHSNLADDGADHLQAEDTGVAELGASILAVASPAVDLCGEAGGGTVVSDGFNVAGFDDAECALGATEVISGPIGLLSGGPRDNGGPTATIALGSTGGALDAVPAAQCDPAEGTDQRGVERPFGSACDAGPYERASCLGTPIGAGALIAAPGGGTLTGTGAGELLVGGAARDVIRAGGGDDRVCAAAGDDAVKGQDGRDTLLGESGDDTVRGGEGNDAAFGGGGEDLLLGNAGGDGLFGDAGGDKLIGGKGRDRLRGGPGRDRLRGGPGRDRLRR
jgi:Ca2+-binding RTX toxin-like protein